MNKIKVLMVGNHPSVKGGISSVINQLLNHDWSKNNVEMKFISTYIEANALLKIVYYFIAYFKIRRVIQKNKPDVVHIHMSYRGSFFRKYQIHKLCKKYRVADIIHLNGSEFKKWFDSCSKKKMVKSLLCKCNRVIVLGRKWNDIILNIEPQARTFVIGNTVHIPSDVVHFDMPFKVLFMGVLIKRKGVFDLMEAIKYLKESGRVDNIKFVIAGTGAEEEELKKICTKYELDKYVKFMGWISGQEKADLYKECQMVVLPSYNEGLPISILEAISYGMPVVATDVGDISSAVLNEVNGYLIEPGDAIRMANEIYKISSSKELYDKLSKASRQLAESKFSDREYFLKLAKLYQKLVDDKNEEMDEIC